MSENWETDLRRDRRRRWVGAAIGVLVVAVLGLVAGSLRTGPDDATERVVGDEGATPPVNTSPFELAAPRFTPSTTAPYLEPYETTTTTAPPITLPPLASYPSGDQVCAAVNELYSLSRQSQEYQESGQLVAKSVEHLRTAVALLAQTQDPAYAAPQLYLTQAADQIEQEGTDEAVAKVLLPLLNQTTETAREVGAVITRHASKACPGLIDSDRS